MNDTVKLLIELPEKTVAHIRSDYGHGKGYYPLNDEDKKIVNDAIYNGIALKEVDVEHDNHLDLRAEKLNNLSCIRHAIEEYDQFKGRKN